MSSDVSDVAVRPKKKPKAKKSQSKSAKPRKSANQRKSENPRKTKRGGRTYYKYSPNTGKRIRMTTKKKKITGGDKRPDHNDLLDDLHKEEGSKYINTLFAIVDIRSDRTLGIYKLVGTNINYGDEGILTWNRVYIPPDRWREGDNDTLETGPGMPIIYLPYSDGSMLRA